MYAVALVPGCIESPVLDPICLSRIAFTLGWWLAFGRKLPARTLLEKAPGIVGAILVLIGIVGQFYFVWHR